MTDNILYHGYDFFDRLANIKRPDGTPGEAAKIIRPIEIDLADYNGDAEASHVYPLRIRAAAAEVHARRAAMTDYIQHGKDIGNCDYDMVAALVADAADAEDALVNLISVWQSASLVENTSLLQWLDQAAAGERDYEER